jgi:ribosomal protein S27AE
MAVKKKEKKYIVRFCPKCGSDDVVVAIGEKVGTWKCNSCEFKSSLMNEKEMNEDEFLEYEEKKGELNFDLGEPETVEEKGAKKSYKDLLREKLARGEQI